MDADDDFAAGIARNLKALATRPDDGIALINLTTMVQQLLARIRTLESDVEALQQKPGA